MLSASSAPLLPHNKQMITKVYEKSHTPMLTLQSVVTLKQPVACCG